MSRRQAREAALQTLFQLELNPPSEAASEEACQMWALDAAVQEMPVETKRDYSYAASLVCGTREHLAAIDEEIAASTHDWKLDRMTGVDRNIVRIALRDEVRCGKGGCRRRHQRSGRAGEEIWHG